MTVLLALIHAHRTNPTFKPELLYFGTFLIDLTLIEVLLK